MPDQSLDEFHSDFLMSGESKPAPAEHPLIDRSRWGLFPDFDITKYHLGMIEEPTLSQGQMRRLLEETPLDFAYNNPQLNPDGARENALETAAARRGDIVHQLALGKGKGFEVLPREFKDFRKGDAKDLRDAAIKAGRVPVLADKFDEAQEMAEVIRERIEEAVEGEPYETEVAFLYQEMTTAGPVWVRGLLDVWCPSKRLILDPKVTAMLYDHNVGRHLVAMGWDRQAALYAHAVGRIIGQPGHVRFADLMVKPEAPFTSRVVALRKEWEASAVYQCRLAMERFGRCLYAGEWPGFEKMHFAELPAWEAKRREAIEELGEI